MTGFIWLYNFRVYLEDYYPDLNKHDLKKINTESGTFHTWKKARNWLISKPQLLYLVLYTSRCFVNSGIPEFIVSGKNPKEVLHSASLRISNEYTADFLPQMSYLCTRRGAVRKSGRLCGLERRGGGRKKRFGCQKVLLKGSSARKN